MLEALGVDTNRTLSVVETGESLERGDEPSPTRSAVMVRLSHSHIRYGTFQRLAYLDEGAALTRLVEYCVEHFVAHGRSSSSLPSLSSPPNFSSPPNLSSPPKLSSPRRRVSPSSPEEIPASAGMMTGEGDPYAALMHYAVDGAAQLAASYRVAGFVHGVLNTDNINITGESFDYGPWRFAPRWEDGFTAAYFDQWGLYAFGRQAEALQWNVHQLALALRTVCEADSLIPALKTFAGRYEAALVERMLWRLGVTARTSEEDTALVQAWETALAAFDIEPDRAFFDWRGGAQGPANPAYDSAAFRTFAGRLSAYDPAPGARDHDYWSDPAPCSMLIDEVEAIWSAIADRDDWAPLTQKIAAIRRMGAALGKSAEGG
jgi:uncharacterized protein YdiU (UPF0061 family)